LKRRKGILLSVLGLVGIVLGVFVYFHLMLRPGPVEVGAFAPDFRLTSVQGISYRLADFRGQAVLLSFIDARSEDVSSSVVNESRSQVVSLKSMAYQYGSKGVQVLVVDATALSEGERLDRAELLSLVYNWDLEMVPVLMDTDTGATVRMFGVSDSPTTLVIGPDGRVMQRWDGVASSAQLALALQTQVGLPDLEASSAPPLESTQAFSSDPISASDAQDAYYVDCSASSAGTGTKASPWNSLEIVNTKTFTPGSWILFKSGTVCTGTLSAKGSGEDGKPIIVDRYGAGDKPVIAGAGASNAVYLYNQQYWEIRNLEITNDSVHTSRRRGVYIVVEDIGLASYYRLINLKVHHVKGDNVKGAGGSAGIMLEVIGTKVPTRFDDIIVDGCTVYTVDRTGITNASSWMSRPAIGRATDNWLPWTNLVIRNNTVYDVGGDGIVVRNATGALVEHNVVHDANVRSRTANVGIWAWNSDYTVFQYNEAYLVRTTDDGQGFDVDFGQTGTIFQYNYSHDNEGGFMLICTPGDGRVNQDAIIRYNVSQNDRTRIFRFLGPTVNTRIYNNTIYVGPRTRVLVVDQERWGQVPISVYFYNNIIYNEGSGGYRFTSGTTNEFDHNLFYGNPAHNEPNDPHKLTDDPLLVNPGSGRVGIDTVDGYQLQSDSPAVGSGMVIQNNGGRDFWGNVVPQDSPPDCGAYQH
jgi:hypothetical protein